MDLCNENDFVNGHCPLDWTMYWFPPLEFFWARNAFCKRRIWMALLQGGCANGKATGTCPYWRTHRTGTCRAAHADLRCGPLSCAASVCTPQRKQTRTRWIDAVSFECGDTVCVEAVYCCRETVWANFTFVRLPVLSVCSANIFFLALRVVHDRAGPVSVVAELSKLVQHQ